MAVSMILHMSRSSGCSMRSIRGGHNDGLFAWNSVCLVFPFVLRHEWYAQTVSVCHSERFEFFFFTFHFHLFTIPSFIFSSTRTLHVHFRIIFAFLLGFSLPLSRSLHFHLHVHFRCFFVSILLTSIFGCFSHVLFTVSFLTFVFDLATSFSQWKRLLRALNPNFSASLSFSLLCLSLSFLASFFFFFQVCSHFPFCLFFFYSFVCFLVYFFSFTFVHLRFPFRACIHFQLFLFIFDCFLF